jgi:integrase
VVYTAGLRFGELVSLMWPDIDFEKAEVGIHNRLVTTTIPPFHVKDYEARRIPLPKHTLDILADLKAYNEATDQTPFILLDDQQYKTVLAKWRTYQQQGRAWRNQDMVNNTLREFRRHLRQARIKPNGTLSIHTLRKSCIQNWANELPINVTKELAGHSSIETTQKYYLQVDEYHRVKAAAVIEALVTDCRIEPEKFEMNDARMTPGANSGHSLR